jgi:hypothetical protein
VAVDGAALAEVSSSLVKDAHSQLKMIIAANIAAATLPSVKT